MTYDPAGNEGKMRAAIPVWQSRISPVFDTAGHLLILDVDGDRELNRNEQSIMGLSPQKRVDRLVELDVDELLCGAISRPLAGMVAASGIRVVPWLTGDIRDVLQWYLAGKQIDPQFLMPGCRRRRRCYRRAQGRANAKNTKDRLEDDA